VRHDSELGLATWAGGVLARRGCSCPGGHRLVTRRHGTEREGGGDAVTPGGLGRAGGQFYALVFSSLGDRSDRSSPNLITQVPVPVGPQRAKRDT